MNDTWTFVCTDTELLPGEMKTVCDDITGTPIVVFNIDGELYALEDRCSHEDYPLSPGHLTQPPAALNAHCTAPVSTYETASHCALRPTPQ